MKDKLTVSTFEMVQMFPNQEAARLYLESKLWPDGVKCPFCQVGKGRITSRKGGYYRCNDCQEDFTVRTGTIFERSHVPLHKWLYAMYLLLTSRKGISSLQLSKEISITQKSAWYLLGRIRESCGGQENIESLRGIVEIDETYVGGKEMNKHANKKLNSGRGTVGKQIVMGMRERGGKAVSMVIPDTTASTLQGRIKANIEAGATIHTDDHASYVGIKGYKHKSVNHTAREYVRGDVHTNSIESVWAVLKRGLNGVYHHASKKHLPRYLDEFEFRLNEGNVKVKTMDRIETLVKASKGKRLTYARLIS